MHFLSFFIDFIFFFLDAWLRFAPLNGPSACIGERSYAALCSASLRIFVCFALEGVRGGDASMGEVGRARARGEGARWRRALGAGPRTGRHGWGRERLPRHLKPEKIFFAREKFFLLQRKIFFKIYFKNIFYDRGKFFTCFIKIFINFYKKFL